MTETILWGSCIAEGVLLIFLFLKWKEAKEHAAELGNVQQEAAFLKAQVDMLTENKQRQETETASLRSQVGNLQQDAVRLETEKKNLEAAQTQLQKEKKELLDTYRSEFKTVATDILNEQTKLFKQGNKEEMEHVVKPLNERLAEFKQKVETFASENHSDKNVLNDKIQQIENVALKFISTLKISAGSGLWGEHTVRELLELMLFKKGVTYFEQETHNDKRPDFLVRLPNNHLVVIDAKTIYSEYESYCNADDVTKQKKHLQAHAKKIRTTITSLFERKYKDEIADFCKQMDIPEDENPISLVLMLVNPEGALTAALTEDPSLLQWAHEKNVVLVSAATLAGALSIIQALWTNDKKSEDYEKMNLLAQDLVGDIGLLLKAQVNMTNALNKAVEENKYSIKMLGNDKEGLLKTAQELANYAPNKMSNQNIDLVKKSGYTFTGEQKSIKEA